MGKIKEMAISGNIEEIEGEVYVPYYNTLKKIASDHAPKVPPINTLDHEWHYGKTNTGKSRSVREKYPDAFIKTADKWWCGYRGESVVIIEDLDRFDIRLGRDLKLWGDHYAFAADSKHQGKRDIRPHKIVITSNWHPKEIWADEQTWGPILRRYKLVEHTKDQGELVVNEMTIGE